MNQRFRFLLIQVFHFQQVIIHKTSCPACKSLKPKFSSSDEISKLSNNFVMVNANNGEDPSSDPKLSPDGSYVPRILFLNPEGELLSDVINEQVGCLTVHS